MVTVDRPKGRAIAAGILCALAATVALWSGPLAAASSALHSGPPMQLQVRSTPHVAR